MSNKIEITSYYDSGKWVVESKVISDEENFPLDIYLWTVAPNGALDKFKAIAQIDEVAKYPLYDSSRTNNFGIRQVRFNKSRVEVESKEIRDKCITVLKSAFSNLLTGWDNETKKIVEIFP